ncbi:hypothetical protein GQ600_7591 [Phytophthora cactorum]|nr:hypothetical protein GQ600_7591 [Phytophthora cactorum]
MANQQPQPVRPCPEAAPGLRSHYVGQWHQHRYARQLHRPKVSLFSVGLTELPPATSLLRGARTLLWRSTTIWRYFDGNALNYAGWSCERSNRHRFGIPVKFGITLRRFDHDGRADKVLLAFAPLIDDESPITLLLATSSS